MTNPAFYGESAAAGFDPGVAAVLMALEDVPAPRVRDVLVSALEMVEAHDALESELENVIAIVNELRDVVH